MGSWMLVLCTTVTLMPVCLHGAISVRFKTGRPLYVALGRTLVLEVEFKKDSDDKIDMVTWDRERGNVTVRLSHGNRISLENGDALLRVTDVAEGDLATYKVTVTDSNGYQQQDSIEVQKTVAVHHVSVMVNVSHWVLHCMEAWGTEPTFTWLHEKVLVTKKVGHVSADGMSLYVSGGSFCEACRSTNMSTTAVVVFLLLILMLAAASLAFILRRRHRCGCNRRERLREPCEESL